MVDEAPLTAEAGRRKAEEAIAQGRLIQLTTGALKNTITTCPKCVARYTYPLEHYPDSCARCRGPLINLRSMGGGAWAGVNDYLRGFNDAMEEHVRAKFNPRFRWADVKPG